MADLSKWEQTLRNNGYTNQDLITIANSIVQAYEAGLAMREQDEELVLIRRTTRSMKNFIIFMVFCMGFVIGMFVGIAM